MRIQTLTLSLVGLGLTSACGGTTEPPPAGAVDPIPLAVEHAVDTRIIPSMQAFADAATALHDAVEQGCPSPSQSDLQSWQSAYLDLRERWGAASLYNLGPLDDDIIVPSILFVESMRLRGTDYTETVREHLAAALTSSAALDAAYFEPLTFKHQGLLALEVLLFEDTSEAHSNAIEDVTAEYVGVPRKCAYLRGMSNLLAVRANQVADGWTGANRGPGEAFRDRMLSESLEDGSTPAQALLIAVLESVDYILDRKLNGILDLRIASAARPDAMPFFRSLERSLDELDALLATNTADGTSFADIMSRRGYIEEVAALQLAIEAARQSARTGDLEASAASFDGVQERLADDVPDALGVYLGVNFSDGD